jgi:hypothetical protein
MHNRYLKSQKIINNSQDYQELFDRKKINYILQNSTFDFGRLREVPYLNFDKLTHVVGPHERLDQISSKYYGSPEYGWVILFLNMYRSEFEIQTGDLLDIYMPISGILELL